MRAHRLMWRAAVILPALPALALLLLVPLAAQERPVPASAPKTSAPAPLPAKYDLRQHDGVTPVRSQSGGTCWTHGTMAAIESNLLVAGSWKKCGMTGEPNLAEYHLDWWNGFNKFHNEDLADPSKSGLTVHMGGDYRVSTAYIARGDGVVFCPDANDGTIFDKKWYPKAPARLAPNYVRFYVRDVEWFTVGEGLENMRTIKRRIMSEGAVATAYCVSRKYLSKDNVHYQPLSEKADPNHSVAIVGWDDTKITTDTDKQPPLPGAWLIKNSWGLKRGDQGYYWISYFDKHAGRHPEMGIVSFRNIEKLAYDQVYLHDNHGWRDTLKEVSKAFNAYKATGDQQIKAVSFYTAADNVGYTVKIYSRFEDGKLLDERVAKAGVIPITGFHTIDLAVPLPIKKGEAFYVYLDVTAGGQPIDRTSEIPVLLDGEQQPKPPAKHRKPIVISKAQPGESFYHDGSRWKDLQEYRFVNPDWATFDRTANFCMKALAVNTTAAPLAE